MLQQNSDITLKVIAPDGKKLPVADNFSERNESERSSFIAEAIEKYRTLQAEIRRQSPQFAALTDPELLNLADIQAKVLDEDSILLEYSLGAERSFLFAVTVNTLDVYELPKREIV